MSMKSGKRNQLAEKMAGEITLSDSPGHALKKWRMNFEIAPGVLSERLGVSPSVISDYESGRRKSPGTAVVGKIVDTLLTTDEETGGKHIEKYSTMLFSAVDDDVIYDLHEYGSPVQLKEFSDAIGCTLLCGSIDQTIFGYTVVNSLMRSCNSHPMSSIACTAGARNGRWSLPMSRPENHRWLRSG